MKKLNDKKILDVYLKTNKSRLALAKNFKCSEWKIRRILANAPSRYSCQNCNQPLRGKNRKYCSKNCFLKDKRKYKNCKACNEPLTKKENMKYCDKCSCNLTKQTAKELVDKRRNLLLNIKGNKCEICGYEKCKSALHFHHRNASEKKFTLSGSGISGHTWESILLEIAKCDLICANCHIETEEKLRQQAS